jgi:hypothetical protein
MSRIFNCASTLFICARGASAAFSFGVEAKRQRLMFCSKGNASAANVFCSESDAPATLRQGEIDLIYFTLTGLIFDLP